MEIIKPLNGKSDNDVTGGGLKMFVDWEKLLPAIEKAVMLRPDEVIDGYTVAYEGISVTIGRKKGRKVTGEDAQM